MILLTIVNLEGLSSGSNMEVETKNCKLTDFFFLASLFFFFFSINGAVTKYLLDL